jgi:glycine/D-amino acid oxidase-like deaminating enzyme/nitrite reductase/ring-hydroxylating ferredoxin subunit
MNAAEELTKSIWMDAKGIAAPQLKGNKSADVVVIGAGIAGLSIAFELVCRDLKVIVVDRGRIGTGMTARTTAHLASAFDDGYAELILARGVEAARIVHQSLRAAIDRVETIQAENKIKCDFQRLDGYLFLASNTPASALDDELKACRKIGVPVSDVRERTPLHAKNLTRSLRFPDQARFHPLKYMAGLAREISRRGGQLYSNTAVESALEEKASVKIQTDRGTLRAAHVVFTTNSPIGGSVTLHTKQGPYRTYAVAATLPRGSLPDALYWDTLDPYHYVRLQPNSERSDIVIIGGEDHKSGEADDGEARFAALENWARTRLPKMGKITHRWSGQVMEPVDYVGFIGRNSGDKHRYIVTGDSGQGITNGVVASLLISAQICDGSSPWEDVYDPGRRMTKKAAGFLSENLTVLKNFAEYVTAGEIKSIERLKPRQGGVFRSGLKKIAACRDAKGRLHLHSAACTHMGCVVHWNSLEQCWDCPCHGSHFAPDGSPLNGPAVAPLAKAEHQKKGKLQAAE